VSGTLQKKICMIGAFSVGKTSLVKRYVQSVFSETYLTTVGVKIDKKTVDVSGRTVNLILWDVAGEDDIGSLRMSYLRGAAGYVLVARVRPPWMSRCRCVSGSDPSTARCRSCCC
jgi:small GTP-binding protein